MLTELSGIDEFNHVSVRIMAHHVLMLVPVVGDLIYCPESEDSRERWMEEAF